MNNEDMSAKLKRESEEFRVSGEIKQRMMIFDRLAEVMVKTVKPVRCSGHLTFKQWFAKRPTRAYTSDSLAQEVWDYFTEEKQ